MNEDKELSPSDEAAESASETAETTGQAAAPAEEGASLKAALEAERKKRIELERSYSEIRRAYNQRDQEINTLRTQLSRTQAGQGEETEPEDNGLTNEVLATREEIAWMRFKQEHPNYADNFDEMKALAADPTMKGMIESYRIVGGRPVLNTFATLHNAYNEVELRKLRKAQATVTDRKAESAVKTKLNKAQATISGDGAASIDTESSIKDASLLALLNSPDDNYDEIINHPAFKQFIDPRDPPRGSNR